MRFPDFHHPITGTVIPVSALRSRNSLGIGEFADLPLLGKWCRETGINLIQILPVNDTGFEPSPYSALSAFALHPIYARLSAFPEAALVKRELGSLEKQLPDTNHLEYPGVLEGKLKILRLMWTRRNESSSPSVKRDDSTLHEWEQSNTWVRNYALFSLLREENSLKAWPEWAENSCPLPDELEKLWAERGKQARFWVWMQWRLEEQLVRAARELDSMGIALKGDIPILITDDSADVWANPTLFRLDLRAGAPPDQYSLDGQNWGFPTYNWEIHRADDFSWWKMRLLQSAKFFNAFRIDHVLGFFRIWSIPEGDISAMNGRFEPSRTISDKDLTEQGFDDTRIRWLSQAHVSGSELTESFGPETEAVKEFLIRIDQEDLWRADPESPTEKEIHASSLSTEAQSRLVSLLRNITLRPAGNGRYSATWNCRETQAWQSLSDDERDSLEELISRLAAESEQLWEQTGRELLKMMKGDGSQLVCAEDLGVIPECVPRVLDDLGILGLRVTRWAREWNLDNQPYTPFSDYPILSVATSSVHDSTTLRQWLAEEAAGDQEFLKAADMEGRDPTSVEGLEAVLSALQKSSSLVAAYPLQDILALDPSSVEPNMEDERINIPGTVQPSNWSRRITVPLENLIKNRKLNRRIKKLCTIRTGQTAEFPTTAHKRGSK